MIRCTAVAMRIGGKISLFVLKQCLNANVMILNARHIPICWIVHQSSDFCINHTKPLSRLNKTVLCFWRLQFEGRENVLVCGCVQLCARRRTDCSRIGGEFILSFVNHWTLSLAESSGFVVIHLITSRSHYRRKTNSAQHVRQWK